VPSKKKKKEKRQDIDIIESVQKHLSHLRELERTNDVALGENPGDQQPFNLAEKIKEKMEQRRLKRKMKEDKKKGKQGDAEPVVDLTMDTAENLSVTVNTGNKSRTVNKESDNRTENKGSEEAIVILDDDKEEDKEESKGFKPYDYAEGAKKLLQGICCFIISFICVYSSHYYMFVCLGTGHAHLIIRSCKRHKYPSLRKAVPEQPINIKLFQLLRKNCFDLFLKRSDWLYDHKHVKYLTHFYSLKDPH
jgi:hypothetical protein